MEDHSASIVFLRERVSIAIIWSRCRLNCPHSLLNILFACGWQNDQNTFIPSVALAFLLQVLRRKQR